MMKVLQFLSPQQRFCLACAFWGIIFAILVFLPICGLLELLELWSAYDLSTWGAAISAFCLGWCTAHGMSGMREIYRHASVICQDAVFALMFFCVGARITAWFADSSLTAGLVALICLLAAYFIGFILYMLATQRDMVTENFTLAT